MTRYLLALFLLAGTARADVYSFSTLPLGKGYVGPVKIDVTWKESGLPRDCTNVTGTFTTYSTAGKVLWTKDVRFAGGVEPTNRMLFEVVAQDTSTPGSYYSELSLTEGGITDALHGTVTIEGR